MNKDGCLGCASCPTKRRMRCEAEREDARRYGERVQRRIERDNVIDGCLYALVALAFVGLVAFLSFVAGAKARCCEFCSAPSGAYYTMKGTNR